MVKIEHEKRKVFIQVHYVKVGEVNTMKECFDAELMVRSRWREPAADGETEAKDINVVSLWNPKLFIDNVIGEPQVRFTIILEHRGPKAYIVENKHFRGSFVEIMELHDYPFDIQELSILIKSDTPPDETELLSDPETMHRIRRGSFIDVQEFYLYRYVICTVPPPPTDGQVQAGSLRRPSMRATVKVARLIQYYVWNVFIQLNLIMILGFATFAIDVFAMFNRLQLCFVILLSGVTFKIVISANTPKISYFTYVDKYVLVNIILLVIIGSWHGLMTRVEKSNRVRIDRLGLIGIAVFYVLFNVIFFFWIYAVVYKERRMMKMVEISYEHNLRQMRRQTESEKQKSNKPKSKPKKSRDEDEKPDKLK